jgi:hypothetical protein
LGIAVNVGFADCQRLFIRLQTIAQHLEHLANPPVARRIAFFGQPPFKVPQAFVGPQQRCRRIALGVS